MRKVAIMTTPDFGRAYWAKSLAARTWRLARRTFLGSMGRHFGRSRVSGPDQVTRSLIMGLTAAGFDVTVEPRSLRQGFDTVFVPTGLAALQAALAAKAAGLVRQVVAGPNICMSPVELELDSAPALPDCYIMPCEWARRRWLGLQPRFPVPVVVAIAGINARDWQPSAASAGRRRVLIYDKWGDASLSRNCQVAMELLGWSVDYLRYGKFTQSTYRRLLSEAVALVYLSKSESQGIALFESWAMNVPSLVLDPASRGFREGSPAPYLTNATGTLFQNPADLPALVERVIAGAWHPRKWIMENGTDEATVRQLLQAIDATNES